MENNGTTDLGSLYGVVSVELPKQGRIRGALAKKVAKVASFV